MRNLIKKVICLLLIAVMAAGLLSACGPSIEEKMQALSGTWTMSREKTEEQTRKLLENIDLYEEEISLAGLTGPQDVKLVTFDYSGEYSFSFDAQAMRKNVRQFYAQTFENLYEYKNLLGSLYNTSFEDMTQEEFNLFYASLYSYDDFEELLDYFTDIAYDYDQLGEAWETGTFHIDGNKIMMMIYGETEEEYLEYSIEGDTLTLVYADDVEVYTRKY